MEDFKKQLLDRGFKIVEVRGDGNCFFNALSLELYGTESRHFEFRKRVADEMIRNPQRYELGLDPNETIDQRVSRIQTDGIWASYTEILAAANALGMNIMLFEPQPFRATPYPADEHYFRTIYLSFHNNNHFNLLAKQPSLALAGQSSLGIQTSVNANSCEAQDNPLEMQSQEIHEDVINLQDEENLVTDSNNFLDDLSDEGSENDDFGQSTDLDGLEFLGAKFDRHGRYKIRLLFFVYKSFAKRTLQESLEHCGKHSVPVFYMLNPETYHVVYEKQFLSEFKVFYCMKGVPTTNFNPQLWRASLVIPHLIFSVLRLKWCGVTLQLLVGRTTNGLMQLMLREAWPVIRENVIDDVNKIIADPTLLMCKNCNSLCSVGKRAWHLNVDNFWHCTLPAHGRARSTFKKHYWYEGRSFESDAEIVPKFRKIFNALEANELTVNEAFSRAVSAIDWWVGRIRCDKWISYLYLMVDGPNMEDYEFETSEELEGIMKFLYAGSCRKDCFIPTHPQNRFGKRKCLSASSRVYLLRKKEFYSKAEARLDEAIVIEILMIKVWKCLQANETLPFYILNRRSESLALSKKLGDIKHHVIRFCNSEIPVFTKIIDDDGRRFKQLSFTGNYCILKEHKLDKEHLKSFEEQLPLYQHIIRRNKNFLFAAQYSD